LKLYRSEKVLAVSGPCSAGKVYKDANKKGEKLKMGGEIRHHRYIKRGFKGIFRIFQ